ncbi:unnamed protein product [Penicillium olsonii]|uniref:NAD(P)-binding protein n=1 Tax=Penicillium olsonii TaxID=99116 RepID=A0A9W4HU68_PENOL|nr:unnamed protein product [Penicillium olsonii]CAG8165262.1 unnamed protein product [Penicillium olsonii]
MQSRVILITGANRGIGKGLVLKYLTLPDVTVIATVRDVSITNVSDLESAPKGPKSRLIIAQLDQGDPSSVSEAVVHIEKVHMVDHIDLVIANAGIANHWGPVSALEDSDVLSHFQVNTLGPLRLFRSLFHLLKAAKTPKFVYLSSELASLSRLNQSASLTSAYGVSKVAGNYLTKKIHEEEPEFIAFSIDPGFVQTDMGNRGAQFGGLAQAPMTVAESVNGIFDQVRLKELVLWHYPYTYLY